MNILNYYRHNELSKILDALNFDQSICNDPSDPDRLSVSKLDLTENQ